MRIEQYADSHRQLWDEFVAKSKNGTFLFQRAYMEYHRDRFQDHSLLVRDEDNAVVAILPAHQQDQTLISHAGLTYGGFVTSDAVKLPKMLEIFEALLGYLQQNAFGALIYKTVPFIYHRAPAEEDRYALYLCNARLVRRGLMTVVASRSPIPWQERRRRGLKKAKQSGVMVAQSEDWAGYWQLLSERLLEIYKTLPVHTLAEIERLHSLFPGNIKLFSAVKAGALLAGVVIFESDLVSRVQYIAANAEGRELGALDLIFSHLLANEYKAKFYFDFGTSDEEDGRCVNKGLIDQKEGYGARVVVHDHYRVEVGEFKPGQLAGALR